MKRATVKRATKKVATKRSGNGKTRRQLSLQALVKAQMEAKVKEVEYNGPKISLQGKVSYRTRLSAVRYAREILVRSKMYDEAARIRDIERGMEIMFNLKIKKNQTKKVAAN